MSKVYLDNAATTKVRDEVADSIAEVIKNEYGNPSSTHSYGRSSKSIIETSRKEIANLLNVSPSEIIFTSGGTEGDNMILRNCVKNLNVKHIVSSKIEHHAVTHTIDYLLTCNDIKISYVKIHSNGNIDYDDLESILEGSSEKTLVSLMHINNELGNISNIKLISDLCKKHDALFHSDTVQSIGHYDLDFNKLKLDFFVASAHKFHGPKGVGFAFVRKNTRLGSFITGGMQEKGFRAGTESVHNIYGMSEALKISLKNLVNEKKYVTDIKNYFITNISNEIKGVKFNGTSGEVDKSTYTLVNVLLPIDKKTGGLLMFKLDMKGIACSKGSACQSGSDNGSHVLNEIQNKQDNENISLRFSFSVFNTKKDIDYTILELKKLII
ncbi:MAG: cysteine desulfurase [Flavobacteriaceae bacterium]|nr:cysteine desulfurase [Flavobacteriaceae bacterium]|tara:strand:+ start:30071 stop:31216 length:1146 start_codon:yes stop_codon:yes gene_type:complete